MKKTIDFSSQQIEFIENLCKEKEISFTETVKRIVDYFIDEMEKKNQFSAKSKG
jgi:hypothetical protein